jgi:hypothetical protein
MAILAAMAAPELALVGLAINHFGADLLVHRVEVLEVQEQAMPI